jgi:hypothetical protein
MNSTRTVDYIHGELIDEFPKLTVQKLTRLINQAYNDGDLAIFKEINIKIDVVEGTRYYAIPTTNRPLRMTGVQYLNSDSEYKPIPRHVGQTSAEDTV